MSQEEQLLAISPLDGRYRNKLSNLREVVSEFGLIKQRVRTEITWLILLASGTIPDLEQLSDDAKNELRGIADTFSVEQAAAVKLLERTTNHDVKAVELWLRQQIQNKPNLSHLSEWIHFGLTSEDVNNVAYALLIREFRDSIILPKLDQLVATLHTMADEYADVAMLSHTHGQPASPTTLGKELNVFCWRLKKQREIVQARTILAKTNGATGNYNALHVAYPDVDWQAATTAFIGSFGFAVSHITTQIEPHDWLAGLCNELSVLNSISIDCARDMWSYISLGYFSLLAKAGEVGSSTMPHKVNPIDFENAEANFGAVNATLSWLAAKLPISRLQRDLSDSSALRTFSEAAGHMVLAYVSLAEGLSKVTANKDKIKTDLEQEWSVLTEAVQTIMRKHGVQNAYDKIKQASRGKSLTKEEYLALVEQLEIPNEEKEALKQLTPESYVGIAAKLARQ